MKFSTSTNRGRPQTIMTCRKYLPFTRLIPVKSYWSGPTQSFRSRGSASFLVGRHEQSGDWTFV